MSKRPSQARHASCLKSVLFGSGYSVYVPFQEKRVGNLLE